MMNNFVLMLQFIKLPIRNTIINQPDLHSNASYYKSKSYNTQYQI